MKDKILENLIKKETKRQKETINLIPSENYASKDILQVIGSALTNKYSEGYPGKRYYPGNEYCDEIERLAQERALKVFGLAPAEWAVNVQPYSGSPANIAIYAGLMNFGDTLMGLQLAAGGHLTHGHKVNFSGKAYKVVHYGVDAKTGFLDYNEIRRLAEQTKPKVIVSGLTAYPRKIDFKKFGEIADAVGAYHVADISHIAGLVAAGLHESPFAHSDAVMTTTHKALRGPRGAVIFSRPEIAKAIDKAVFPGMQGGPHNNLTAAKALMFFEALQPDFKKYQQQTLKNSHALAKALQSEGFRLVTGGTDNHLLLINLRDKKISGLEAEKILEKNNINANRNSIPGDESPFKPAGLRAGTPALTTRGMKEPQMKVIARLMKECLVEGKDVRKSVAALCRKFPLDY